MGAATKARLTIHRRLPYRPSQGRRSPPGRLGCAVPAAYRCRQVRQRSGVPSKLPSMLPSVQGGNGSEVRRGVGFPSGDSGLSTREARPRRDDRRCHASHGRETRGPHSDVGGVRQNTDRDGPYCSVLGLASANLQDKTVDELVTHSTLEEVKKEAGNSVHGLQSTGSLGSGMRLMHGGFGGTPILPLSESRWQREWRVEMRRKRRAQGRSWKEVLR